MLAVVGFGARETGPPVQFRTAGTVSFLTRCPLPETWKLTGPPYCPLTEPEYVLPFSGCAANAAAAAPRRSIEPSTAPCLSVLGMLIDTVSLARGCWDSLSEPGGSVRDIRHG